MKTDNDQNHSLLGPPFKEPGAMSPDDMLAEFRKLPGPLEYVPLGLPLKRLAFSTIDGEDVRLYEKEIAAMKRRVRDGESPSYDVFLKSGACFTTASTIFAPYFEEPRP